GTTKPIAVVLADVDGDKKLDVVTTGENGTQEGAVTVLRGDGTGKLGQPTSEPVLCQHPGGVLATALNGDVIADYLITCADDGAVSALTSDGKAHTAIRVVTACKSAGHIAAGDLDGDGVVDAVVACTTGQGTAILRGRPMGEFTAPTG